jgi:hypothetical protein
MPLSEPPPSAMPTGRIPTPAEFVTEALRRSAHDPRTAGVAAMVEQVVSAAGVPGAEPTEDHRRQLWMGALLALVVDERFDEITEHAIDVRPPAGAVAGPPLTRTQALWALGEDQVERWVAAHGAWLASLGEDDAPPPTRSGGGS